MQDMIVTTEILAAYVEGNASKEEREAVLQYLTTNPDAMQSILFAMEDNSNIQSNSSSYTHYIKNLGEMLDDIAAPDTQLSSTQMATLVAAQNSSDNLCVVRCEGIALRHFGHNVTDEELLEESKQEGWLQSSGTIFTDIGKLSEKHGLKVQQVTHGNLEMLVDAISEGCIIIVFVDEGELTGDYIQEKEEDLYIGGCPDHVVIVQAISKERISIIDSYTPEQTDSYPIDQFLDAWNDSQNFLVLINK